MKEGTQGELNRISDDDGLVAGHTDERKSYESPSLILYGYLAENICTNGSGTEDCLGGSDTFNGCI